MTYRRLLLVGGIAVVIAALSAPSAQAIPAFARKYNLACSSCHNAFPYLNSTGRAFKEAGYVMPDEDGEVDYEAQPNRRVSDSLIFDKDFPISARIKGYLVDDKEGSDTKIRPLHELEILTAGNFWKKGSWIVELEGEDEEDFATEASGSFAWHFNRAANFEVGFGPMLRSDPYNSLNDGHRLTVNHKIPLDVGKAVDARIRKDTQFLNFYGRKGNLFYIVGYSAGNGNPEGEDPNDAVVRLAYDFTPDLMVGGFYFDGERGNGPDKIDLTRYGIDFNLAFNDLNIDGMYMSAEEDAVGPGSVTNDAGFVEFFYTKKKNGRPFFVPILRYDFTEANDGADTIAAVTAQIGFYVVENAKFALEYYSETDQVPGVSKSDRITLLADIGF